MSEMIDKRKKTANNEQEYAHKYPFDGQNETYMYQDEDKRVKFHVDSDTNDGKSREELYGIDPDGEYEVEVQPNKIRVRINKEDIMEDHRQQSYKVRTKPQVYDKTDHGLDSFQLNNDPHKQEVEFIKRTTQNFETRIEEENQRDLSSPNDRYVKYKEEDSANNCFEVGMKVAHIEENISGEIKFVNEKRVTVAWEDKTRERFSLAEANQFLKAYVDYAQEQVAPTQTTPFPKDEQNSVVEKALTALEGDFDEENQTEKLSKIDIEKAKLQRQVNELKSQVDSHNIAKIKEKAAKDLVNLMQKKGMIGDSDEDINFELNRIMNMDDESFEEFQTSILNSDIQKDSIIDEVYAALEEEVDDDIEIEDGQEYAKIREQMKKASVPKRTVDGIEMGDTSFFENGGLAGFKGTIGDFSSAGATSSTPNSSKETAPRSLSTAKAKTIQRTASERREDNGLDLSGFQNLQGLKTPINIPSKETTAGSKFSELFSSMDWTIISKK